MPAKPSTSQFEALRDFGRAAGGALVFALPMLMTMEVWYLGFYMERSRLLILVASALPLLVLLSRRIGFEDTQQFSDDLLDAALALAVGAVVCATLLVLFGMITAETPPEAAIGMVALQTAPAAIGALLARSQFGAAEDEEPSTSEDGEEHYVGELFLMGVGALFLGFNVAPTEEILLISYQMGPWHALALVAVSILLMHGFVFAVSFAGGSSLAEEEPQWSAFLRLTVPGYVIALAISLYLLWLFSRMDGMDASGAIMAAVVLAFPCAIGAAAARLVL